MNNIPEPNLPPARPRRSSFASAAPTQPAPQPTTTPTEAGEGSEVQSPKTETTRSSAPQRSQRVAADRGASRPAAATTSKRSPAFSRDILLSVADEQKARLENTVAWTAPRTGVKSQQAFIRWGIDELCSRLEREYNGGKPFDPIAEQNL